MWIRGCGGKCRILIDMQVLGIRIDELTKQQALEKAREFLLSDKSHKIFTPNPEMLVDAQKDANFKVVLNGGDMNLCDGFGLWLITKFRTRAARVVRNLSKNNGSELQSSDVSQSTVSPKDSSSSRLGRDSFGIIERITGVDFMMDLCALAEKENKSIYLLGSGSDEVVKKTAQVLQDKFPMLKIAGHDKGLSITKHGTWNMEQNEDLLYDIITKAPDILFVAFGHGKQEKWIAENLRDLPSVKIAIGVGGAFDFISGKVKRAPKWMRKIGLEWLWRLILQPCRVGRILKATFVFLFMFYRTQISRITRIRQDHG